MENDYSNSFHLLTPQFKAYAKGNKMTNRQATSYSVSSK